MKGLLALLMIVVVFSISSIAQADYTPLTANASPVIVSITISSPTKEVTFPITVRNVSVLNYDASDGVWVNFRGSDTDGLAVNSSRFYLGPSSTITLDDFQTDSVTLIRDTFFSSGVASPVSVIATY